MALAVVVEHPTRKNDIAAILVEILHQQINFKEQNRRNAINTMQKMRDRI